MTTEITALSVNSLSLQELLAKATYLIPMYQRNYAWGKGEIETLIKDVIDACEKHAETPYYLGTLVVFKRSDGSLEVIDGQQRLTTLILLVIYFKHSPAVDNITIETPLTEDSSTENTTTFKLKDYTQVNISFESRPESRRTLEALNDTPLDNRLDIINSAKDKINLAILNGYHTITDVIKEQFNTNDKAALDLQLFCHYLFNKVKIAQVPVPEETDLNHYFEVMNNRGEQLEKHEIIKARLLAIFSDKISDEEEKKAATHLLHTVWEACANINKYVQYGFNTSSRTAIFSESWDTLVPNNFKDLFECFDKSPKSDITKDTAPHQPTLNAIITGAVKIPPPPEKKNHDKDDDSEIYYSLVNFPNFLLHVLRIMLNTQDRAVDISLDDKQLLPQFEKHIIGKEVVDPLSQAKQFIYALVKTKFLFDHYVIKRKPRDNKHWSLERLNKNDSSSSYNQSITGDLNTKLVMLQSAFHISAPTMNYKHWLNASLYYLYSSYHDDETGIDSSAYLNHLEDIARAFMLRRYLANEPEDYYTIIYKCTDLEHTVLKTAHSNSDAQAISTQIRQLLSFGSIRNNFVFSYLDYLIWKNINNSNSINLESDKKNFKFISQGSREHFYPQNPINVTTEQKDVISSIDLHRFGNLCLINHGLNSRVSNHVPSAKKQYFAKEFETNIDSLKLYKMIETLDSANNNWGKEQIKKHEKEMFTLFENALNIQIKDVADE